MTVYADSDFYMREYLGGKQAVISPALFPFYARKASSYIDQYTFDRLQGAEIPEAVKMCCCELAETLYRIENSPTYNGVASERVGDISVNYESGASRQQSLNNSIKSVITTWLINTGLMYRGGAYA
jgi:hypothetical protein